MSYKHSGPVVGATCYVKGDLVAKDVSIALPAITFVTYDFSANGTVTLPTALTEALELTITKIGEDKGLLKLIQTGLTELEVRWAMEQVENTGEKKIIGCKAFLNGYCKEIPSASITVGEAYENAIPYSITRYRKVVDGKEQILIDKLKSKLTINGKNMMDAITKLL